MSRIKKGLAKPVCYGVEAYGDKVKMSCGREAGLDELNAMKATWASLTCPACRRAVERAVSARVMREAGQYA